MASSPGTTGGGTIDFARPFQFFFEDPDWVRKVVIGGLLYLAGTLTLVLLGAGLLLYAMVAGYSMRVMQRAYGGDPRPLPEWGDYGGLMRDGLKLLAVWIAYALAIFGVPTMVVAVLGMIASASRSDAVGGIFALFTLLLQLLFLLLGLALAVYLPAAIARMTLYQRLGAGFEVKENIALIRRNPSNYGLAVVVILLAHLVSQFGILLCCVGVFATSFWSMCVMGFVLGEMVRRDPLIGQPLAVAPSPAPTPGL